MLRVSSLVEQVLLQALIPEDMSNFSSASETARSALYVVQVSEEPSPVTGVGCTL